MATAADPIPEPFGLETREQLLAWLTPIASLYTNITRYPSLCNTFPSTFADYINRCTAAGTSSAKSAVAAKMIEECLRPCNPVLAQMEVLLFKNVTKAHTFFSSDPDAESLSKNYYKYMAAGSKCENPEELKEYRESVCKFRMTMEYSMPEAQTLQGTVQTELSVGNNSAGLLNMVARMIKKRNTRLGIKEGGQKLGKGVTQDHIAAVMGIISQDMNDEILVPEWKNGLKTKNAAGLHLFSTGMAYLMQNGNTEAKAYYSKMADFTKVKEGVSISGKSNQDFFHLIVSEIDRLLMQLGRNQSEYYGQIANIDPIWFTFFIAFKQCNLSVVEFYNWQRAVYTAARFIKGRVNMKSMLTSLISVKGISSLISNASASGEIHLPPWIFTMNRIYDISATIGCGDCKNMKKTVMKPSISWRYFLMLDYKDNKDSLGFIVSLDAMEEDALSKTSGGDIRQSEKMLQQVIMGRDSPLANTNTISGNALNVTIKA